VSRRFIFQAGAGDLDAALAAGEDLAAGQGEGQVFRVVAGQAYADYCRAAFIFSGKIAFPCLPGIEGSNAPPVARHSSG
jgi:hypothetical protein